MCAHTSLQTDIEESRLEACRGRGGSIRCPPCGRAGRPIARLFIILIFQSIHLYFSGRGRPATIFLSPDLSPSPLSLRARELEPARGGGCSVVMENSDFSPRASYFFAVGCFSVPARRNMHGAPRARGFRKRRFARDREGGFG